MVQIIYKMLQSFLDSLFPFKKSDQLLFSLSKEEAYLQLPPAPKPPYNFIKSIFAYKNEVVTSLIWNIKYKKSVKAVEIGGYALYKKILSTFETKKDKILIIPIPISQKRRNERGYNQCELLLAEIQKLDINHELLYSVNLLKRKIHKDRQTLKNRQKRLENAKQIFEINKIELEKIKKVQYKIIIIDDVVTTGSTLKEAINLLRSAGFDDVSGLSLAH